MDIPADGDGGADGLYVGLLDEDGSDQFAESLQLGLEEVFAGAQLADGVVCRWQCRAVSVWLTPASRSPTSE